MPCRKWVDSMDKPVLTFMGETYTRSDIVGVVCTAIGFLVICML